jgi:hypothetical protein
LHPLPALARIRGIQRHNVLEKDPTLALYPQN